MTSIEYKERIDAVLAVFNDFYGEENVDLQGMPSRITETSYFPDAVTIYVHWNTVVIANEFNESTCAEDMYAKISVKRDGRLDNKFSLNRSTYSMAHYVSGYMHSHISYIPKPDPSSFQFPCTGTGPINNTMNTLQREYNLDLWTLFCCELNAFVHTESVSGGPYHRLKHIGDFKGTKINFSPCYHESYLKTAVIPANLWKEFIAFYLSKSTFKIAFRNGTYIPGESYAKFIMNISEYFSDWYQEKKLRYTLNHLKDSRVLINCRYIGDSLYMNNGIRIPDFSARGRKVLTFKGEDILLEIYGDMIEEHNEVLILNPEICNVILTVLLGTFNCYYEQPYKDAIFI